jgi:hypothetical protein
VKPDLQFPVAMADREHACRIPGENERDRLADVFLQAPLQSFLRLAEKKRELICGRIFVHNQMLVYFILYLCAGFYYTFPERARLLVIVIANNAKKPGCPSSKSCNTMLSDQVILN